MRRKRLFRTIKDVLEKGIHFGGTSMRDYINSDGETGSFQEELLVYGRRGEDCFLCGSEIEKIVVSQRGTHFCPTCQPRSRPETVSRRVDSLQLAPGQRWILATVATFSEEVAQSDFSRN